MAAGEQYKVTLIDIDGKETEVVCDGWNPLDYAVTHIKKDDPLYKLCTGTSGDIEIPLGDKSYTLSRKTKKILEKASS